MNFRLPLFLLTFLPLPLLGQLYIGHGQADYLFRQACSACHGDHWEGGRGGSLLKGSWNFIKGNEEDGLAHVIRDGIPVAAMPGFAGKLSEGEIRSLVIFIQERRALDRQAEHPAFSLDETFHAGKVAFRLETVVDSDRLIWAAEFLPDGRLLFTERWGALRIADPAHPGNIVTVAGIPAVWSVNTGGMLDVGLPPDFAKTGWIYLAYSEGRTSFFGGFTGGLRVIRGRIRDGQWTDQQDIFRTPVAGMSPVADHFGCRFAFRDGMVFFGIGDRREVDSAQSLASPNGKIYRFHEDGTVPSDNPFAKDSQAIAGIWSLGHRNPQGLVFRPGTDQLWESEHGPRGGDEINLIEPGKNYGWPKITYGMNDDGSPITAATAAPGLEQPRHYWTPSIAVCGIAFSEGDMFPTWKGDLLAGGLHSGELHRLRLRDRDIVEDEIVMRTSARIRDIINGPDGTLYLVLNSERGPSRIVRLVPVTDSQANP